MVARLKEPERAKPSWAKERRVKTEDRSIFLGSAGGREGDGGRRERSGQY